jgi:hypothetical protein
MRFLFGILTGAMLTLLVATAMDAPTHPMITGAADLASRTWDRLISSTSDSLFQSGPGADAEPEKQMTPPAESAPEPAPELSASAEPRVIDRRELRAAEPALALPPPDPVDAPPASEFWLKKALATDSALAMENAMASNLAMDASETASPVWVPFHSQMSAEGFATRLSQTLDREFRVERQGAGAYQVVFDAEGPDDRDLILAQISEITGQ